MPRTYDPSKGEMPPINVVGARGPAQPSLAARAVAAGKRAISAIDDAIVPGKKRLSDMPRDAKNIGRMLRGTQPPLRKPGKE